MMNANEQTKLNATSQWINDDGEFGLLSSRWFWRSSFRDCTFPWTDFSFAAALARLEIS